MENKKFALVFLAFFFSIIVAKAEERQDSLKSKELQEVVVTAQRGWVEGDKIVFLPTKREKRLSNSPASLINSMTLPMFSHTGDDETVTTLGGDKVSIYINGNPVTSVDAKAFATAEVKRVEYLEYPNDPTFRGEDRVINIITAKYEVGGVTSIDVSQDFPGGGSYSVASKLEYKRMTYGLLLSGNYSRNHSDIADREAKYKDIYYSGEYFDEITNSQSEHSYNRYDRAGLSFNARYVSGGKVNIIHTANLKWARDPGSGNGSEEFWTPNLFNGFTGSFVNYERSLSPQISGDYSFKLSEKFTFPIDWGYAYKHTDRSSEVITGAMSPIYNATKEDVNAFNLRIRPSYKLTDKFTVQLRLYSSLDWFSTLYTGTANTKSVMNRQDVNASVRTFWDITEKIRLITSLGLISTTWQIGDLKEKSILPTYEVTAVWNPNRFLNILGTFKTSSENPAPSQTTPVLVKNGELMWRIGNPDMKGLSAYSAYLSVNWIPPGLFSLGFSGSYTKYDNFPLVIYSAASSELGGIIGRESSESSLDALMLMCNLDFRFLDSSLKVGLTPMFSYNKYYGLTNKSLAHFEGYANASYTVGNVRLKLIYGLPHKELSGGGFRINKSEQTLSFEAVYGLENLYIKLWASGFFGKRRKTSTIYDSPHYSYTTNSYHLSRSIGITLSYTLNYGKKVDRNINISQGQEVKTSVIR